MSDKAGKINCAGRFPGGGFKFPKAGSLIWLAGIAALCLFSAPYATAEKTPQSKSGAKSSVKAGTPALNILVNADFRQIYSPAGKTADSQKDQRMLPGYGGDPFIPTGWIMLPSRDGACTVSQEKSGAIRVRTGPDETLKLYQQFLELVPGETYVCSAILKGEGKVSMEFLRKTPAPSERTSSTELSPDKDKWRKFSISGKVGSHRHLGTISLTISPNSDISIFGASLSHKPPDDTAALEKTGTGGEEKSPETACIYSEDFESENVRPLLKGPVELTEPGAGYGGGRGLKISAADGEGSISMSFGEIPAKGTIEFWFRPDPAGAEKKKTYAIPLALRTSSAGLRNSQIQFRIHRLLGSLQFGFTGDGLSEGWAETEYPFGWGCWKSGEWHHFAGSWDGNAFRVYFDGVLGGVCFGGGTDGKPLLFPAGKALEIVLAENGIIDDIRISAGLPLGPSIPPGCAMKPFPATRSEKDDTAPEGKEYDIGSQAIEKIRKMALSPVPDTGADYVFGAENLIPAWEGMPGLNLKKNYFGDGKAGMEFEPAGPGSAACWRIDKIEPGKYYLGLWAQTGDARYLTEYSVPMLLATLFRNGWPVRFTTTSDPVQVRNGIWAAELQTGEPVELKNGDEIAVACADIRGNRNVLMRLALYRNPPSRGHGVTGRTFGVGQGTVQKLRLVATPSIEGSGVDGDPHEAKILIANPLPFEAPVRVEWKLADYFGTPLAGNTETIIIPPHNSGTISHKFAAKGEDRAYQIDVRTEPAPEFVPPEQRPREIVELSDWSRMEFSPGQDSPLKVWSHARRDLTAVKTGNRRLQMLDGDGWECAPLTTVDVPVEIPDNLDFRTVEVPGPAAGHELPEGCFGLWFRKKFHLDKWMREDRILVEAANAQSEATFFINGKRTRTAVSHGLPVSADITEDVNFRWENELVICVRGPVSLVNSGFAAKFDPWNTRLIEENQEICGSTANCVRLGPIRVRTSPTVGVTQSVIIPDLDNRTIRTMARIENRSGKERSVELAYRIFHEGSPSTAELQPQKIVVPDGAVVEAVAEGPAGDLREYSPAKPVLSKLVISVSADGQTLDSYSQRFGFRSLKVDKLLFNLNGRSAKLFGGSLHSLQDFLENEDGIDLSGDDSEDIELSDEIGKLHYRPCGPVSSLRPGQMDNRKFLDSLFESGIETVWEHGSHPSVIGWAVSNESFSYAHYTAGAEGQKKHAEIIRSIADTIRGKFSYPFWCIADGDGNLGGLLDFASFHQLNRAVSHGWTYASRDGGFGYFPDGISHYMPDCFFLNRAANTPKLGTVLRLIPDWIYGSSASGDTETFWTGGRLNGVYSCNYLGDRAAASAAWQNCTARGMGWTKMCIDGYRDMEQAIISGMRWNSAIGLGAQDVALAMPEQEIRYFAGAKFGRRINVHDDEYCPGKLDFRWSLIDAGGTAVRSGGFSYDSTTTTLVRERISFDIPEVSERSSFRLAMELLKDGIRRSYEERTVEVWPMPQKESSVQALLVFDPPGKSARTLSESGYNVKKIDTLEEKALAGAKCLVLGSGSVSGEMQSEIEAVGNFVRNGGRAIVLRDNSPSLVPIGTSLEKRAYFSIGFIRAPEHPVMKELKDMDFQMWNPGHLIAEGVHAKPRNGNFLALVDCGYDGTMAWTPLFEAYHGTGSFIVTQLPLLEKISTEPMCRELIRRLVEYCCGPVYRKPVGKLTVLKGTRESIVEKLKEARASFRISRTATAEDKVILADSESEELHGNLETLRGWIADGGILLLYRVKPGMESMIKTLSGQDVSICVQPWQSFDDRQIITNRSGLLEGLNNLDFHWRKQVEGDAVESLWQVSNGVREPIWQVQFIPRAAGCDDSLFPGGFLEMPAGKGRLVLVQLDLAADEKDFIGGSSGRVLSAILTNLGIRIRQPRTAPSLPKNIAYQPIDISSQANWSIRDDNPGDNKGWIDAGPDSDMRNFPAGRCVFQGVPFLVPQGENNAIVLRVNPALSGVFAGCPETVAIPVRKKNVAGLYFLHTGGWISGLERIGERQILYSDGTREIVELNSTNMADWDQGQEEFPGEQDTATTVAWADATPQCPVIRAYKTLWINPHPEKEIDSVVITNSGLPESQWRFIPHLGITAAVLKK